MIPVEKMAAVTRGLRKAFGVEAFEDVSPLTKGLNTALVYRIIVKGTPYRLRIITRDDEINEPTRQYACMQTASDAGIAPRVWYASTADRMCITDFVEAQPFPAAEAFTRMPGVLRNLHRVSPFPKELNYVTVDKMIRRFQGLNLLPQNEIEEVYARHAQLSRVYPRLDEDMVSCHNDLKPENLIFDGHRVWLVDWEAAHVNDRYFDLSILANFLINNGAEERAFLQAYFGDAPSEYQLARFFLMRCVLHMMAASIYLLLGSMGKPIDLTEVVPSFKDFHQRIWAGEIDLADNHMKVVYGRIHWERLMHNMRQARFDESLRVVAERDAGSAKLLPWVA